MYYVSTTPLSLFPSPFISSLNFHLSPHLVSSGSQHTIVCVQKPFFFFFICLLPLSFLPSAQPASPESCLLLSLNPWVCSTFFASLSYALDFTYLVLKKITIKNFLTNETLLPESFTGDFYQILYLRKK